MLGAFFDVCDSCCVEFDMVAPTNWDKVHDDLASSALRPPPPPNPTTGCAFGGVGDPPPCFCGGELKK